MCTSIHIHTHSSHSCIAGLFCAASEPAFSILFMSPSILNLDLLRNVLLPNKTAFTKAGGVAAQVVFMLCRWHTAIQVPFCMSLHSCLLLQKQGRFLWTWGWLIHDLSKTTKYSLIFVYLVFIQQFCPLFVLANVCTGISATLFSFVEGACRCERWISWQFSCKLCAHSILKHMWRLKCL